MKTSFTEVLVQKFITEDRPIHISQLSRDFRKDRSVIRATISSIMSPKNKKWRGRNVEILRRPNYGDIAYEINKKRTGLNVIKDNMDYHRDRTIHHINRELTLSVVSINLKDNAASKKVLLQQLKNNKDKIDIKIQELIKTQRRVEQEILDSI